MLAHQDNETVLLKQIASGKNEGVEQLYSLLYQPLCYFAQKILLSTETAEDIVTDSFIKLLQQPRDFANMSALKSFLYTVVRNSSLNHLKATKRHMVAHEELERLTLNAAEHIENHIIRSEVLTAIYRSIRELPDKYQAVMELALLEGLKNEEISARLGMAPQTVRNHKSAALKLIRHTLLRNDDASLTIILYSLWYLGKIIG